MYGYRMIRMDVEDSLSLDDGDWDEVSHALGFQAFGFSARNGPAKTAATCL